MSDYKKLMDLKKMISQDESETIEFKKSSSESKEIIKTISAFANTKGGRSKSPSPYNC